ncbi:MAG: ABC transporter ATP-binding protein [Fibrobacter sp.]|nr:ABC transporter ATP-binding protein [Fibrobacter sp.]
MIEFKNLSFSYEQDSPWFLQSLNLNIPQGSVFALLGPNGAGKTTLLRLLTGRLSLQSGKINIPAPWQSASGGLDPQKYGMLIENPGIYPRLSIAEYLQFFASFYTVSNPHKRIAELCQLLGLKDLQQKLGKLSLGMRQKLQLARTLLHEPELVLLDEPTSNLDPTAREQIWDILSQWNRNRGATILVCSHLLNEMQEHCTHLGIISEGKLQIAGELNQVLASATASNKVRIHLATPNMEIDYFQALEELASLYPHLQDLQLQDQVLSYGSSNPQLDNVGVCNYLQLRQIPFWQVEVQQPSLAEIYHQKVGKHVADI